MFFLVFLVLFLPFSIQLAQVTILEPFTLQEKFREGLPNTQLRSYAVPYLEMVYTTLEIFSDNNICDIIIDRRLERNLQGPPSNAPRSYLLKERPGCDAETQLWTATMMKDAALFIFYTNNQSTIERMRESSLFIFILILFGFPQVGWPLSTPVLLVSYEDGLALKEGLEAEENGLGSMTAYFRLPVAESQSISLDYFFFTSETSSLGFIEQIGYFLEDSTDVAFNPHFSVFEMNVDQDYEESAFSTEDCLFNGKYCAMPTQCKNETPILYELNVEF